MSINNECPKEVDKTSCNTNGSEVFKIRSRSLFITINPKQLEKLDKIINYFKEKDGLRYILCGYHDKPEKHAHLYALYSKKHTFKANSIEMCHIKKTSSPQATIKYIKCQDKKHINKGINYERIIEEGEEPKQGSRRVKDILEMTKDELEDLDINIYVNAVKIREKIHDEELIDDWLKIYDLEVEWHMGLAGSGKTHYAKTQANILRQEGKQIAVVDIDKNGFFHIIGSKDAELLILNEFRDSMLNYKTFLEILTNEHVYNIKGGHVYFTNLKRIIITTQQAPADIYKNIHEDREQIYRRINTVYYHEKKDNGYDMFEVNVKGKIIKPPKFLDSSEDDDLF